MVSNHHSQTEVMHTHTHASPLNPVDGIAALSENGRRKMLTRILIDAATAVTASVTVSPIVAAVDK
jgi:diadenosine tetraphosphate (Ap4A) HIT family hydrolase